jgi:hypothetical protein
MTKSSKPADAVRRSRIKITGEIFTPPALTNEILDQMPQSLFSDPQKTALDNSAGDGNILVEILKRRLQHMDGTAALSGIYGVEFMADNVERCRQRLLELAGDTEANRAIVERQIVHHNALTYDYSFGEPQGVENWMK